MFPAKLVQPGLERAATEISRRGDADLSTDLTSAGKERGLAVVDGIERRLAITQVDLSLFGQAQLARGPIKQFRLKRGLQLLQSRAGGSGALGGMLLYTSGAKVLPCVAAGLLAMGGLIAWRASGAGFKAGARMHS